ncbi:hypothetical protein GQ53DRAFT_840811 [Thozetella sp. PMI_491]|nr:hypothetical protein GQ53DRAFT_840811 [Thozetella sp. PMI_491]
MASVSDATSDSGQRYVYDNPEPYSFVRLLRLTSPVGAPRIEGELATVRLKGPPVVRPFTAISYTWGQSDATERLWLQKDCYVPINNSASYVLRHMPRGGEIWIDSVCIDQENAAEKEWVIPNMHQVYVVAQEVNVWLGPPSDQADAAFALLRIIEGRGVLSDDLIELFARAPPGSSVDEMVRLQRVLQDNWAALADLLDSPWFRRCWIIQEVVHAQNVTVTCGRDVIPWTLLEKIVDEILETPYLLRRLLRSKEPSCSLEDVKEARGEDQREEISTNPAVGSNSVVKTGQRIPTALYAIRDLSYIRRLGIKQSWGTLQWNLLFFADNQATNPVDRIQALVWVSYATLKNKDLPRPGVSTVETYTRLTGSMIRLNKEIVSLHMAGIGWPGGMADLPSWVPDYTMGHRQPFQSGRITILGRMTNTYFRACNMVLNNIDANILPERSIWMLSLKGILVDTVGLVVEPPKLPDGIWAAVTKGSPEERKCLIAWVNNLERLLDKSSHPPSPRRDRRSSRRLPEWQILADVLVGGKDIWQTKLYYSPSRIRWLEFSVRQGSDLSSVDGYKAFVAILTRLSNNPGVSDPWENLDTDTREAAQVFCEALDDFSDWAVFKTRKGHFGRGPKLTKTDDAVCVFESARTPFLLRRPASTLIHALTLWSGYHLVGEAYVDGWMARQAEFLPYWKRWWFHLV